MSGIVSVLAWNPAKGSFTKVQDVNTLAPNFIGSNDSAEISIHPNGKFLYESNRRARGADMWGPDSIARVYAIDQTKGTLTEVQQSPSGGDMPRFFTLDPTGGYLFAANQVSGNVALFRVDANYKLDVPTVSIVFIPVQK